MIDNEEIIEKMKEGIKKHPVLKKYVEMGMNYGLSEEEAINTMIDVWARERWGNL